MSRSLAPAPRTPSSTGRLRSPPPASRLRLRRTHETRTAPGGHMVTMGSPLPPLHSALPGLWPPARVTDVVLASSMFCTSPQVSLTTAHSAPKALSSPHFAAEETEDCKLRISCSSTLTSACVPGGPSMARPQHLATPWLCDPGVQRGPWGSLLSPQQLLQALDISGQWALENTGPRGSAEGSGWRSPPPPGVFLHWLLGGREGRKEVQGAHGGRGGR
jgi:hypothetical protein